jgi:hypothetical protein
MAKGKKTGGRKKGTPNLATTKRLAVLKAGGKLPLEFMLAEMRKTTNEMDIRRAMAVAAAPYCHPRLAAVEAQHSGNIHHTHEQALNELDE